MTTLYFHDRRLRFFGMANALGKVRSAHISDSSSSDDDDESLEHSANTVGVLLNSPDNICVLSSPNWTAFLGANASVRLLYRVKGRLGIASSSF
jgi:hypothetical protein